MNTNFAPLPKTNCLNQKHVACADYLESADSCKNCGWNPKVAKERLDKIYEKRGTVRIAD